MQIKYLIRVGLGKPFVRRFERELNSLLEQGWIIEDSCDVEHGIVFNRVGFFRFLLWVKLTKISEKKK